MADSITALAIALSASAYLCSRNLPYLILWGVLGYLVAYNTVLKDSKTLSALFGLGVIAFVVKSSMTEYFDDKEEEKSDDEPKPTGKSTPHVDLGTTILHAYRNLSPEQIGGMKKDTKELMELQKELMGTLAEMKPAIEQGAELLGTFSQFFGKPEAPSAPA